MNADGTGEHSITPDQTDVADLHPRVAPDGAHIVWTRLAVNEGESEIWISGPDGENPLRITNHPGTTKKHECCE
jgi:hypothetical protein